MNKKSVKLDVLRQVEELVQNNINSVGPAMDDYDGGQQAAYEKILNDLKAFRAIINHAHPAQITDD